MCVSAGARCVRAYQDLHVDARLVLPSPSVMSRTKTSLGSGCGRCDEMGTVRMVGRDGGKEKRDNAIAISAGALGRGMKRDRDRDRQTEGEGERHLKREPRGGYKRTSGTLLCCGSCGNLCDGS